MHPIMWIPSIEETPQSEADYFKPSPSVWDVVDPMLQGFVGNLAEQARLEAERAALPPQSFDGTSYHYVEYFDTPRPPGYTLDDLTALRGKVWGGYQDVLLAYQEPVVDSYNAIQRRLAESLDRAFDLCVLLGEPSPGKYWGPAPDDHIILGEN
jgi:hypothetical protein